MQSGGSLSGYLGVIQGNGNILLTRYDSGAQTILKQISAGGVTIAAGDVWTLQAAGAVISLYQNGKPRLWFGDATYTSGSPGYIQFTSVNITHTKCLSWRGYNAVQQDGIWSKQGIVIPALSGDLQRGTDTCSMILYEGNAQILSGTVYKMWFCGAYTNIYYAESMDGINWTRRGSAVISNQIFPTIFKNGSTYYLYSQPSASAGTGSFALYTSSDGISWTNQSTTILGLGGVGTWDHFAIYGFQVVGIIAGTWYGLYSGTNSSANDGHCGLATSSDGVTWTKYVSNPVLHAWNSQAIALINGVYYMWCAANQPGQRAGDLLNPTDTVRYQSTDLITWTNPTHSIHHSQIFQGVNGVLGQAFPTAIIDVGSKAYLYVTSSPDDTTANNNFQISLATAPSTTQAIVMQSEDAAQQIATDAFTSGIGDLSANWTTPTGSTKLQIVAGNLVEATATSTNCAMYYSGASFGTQQYSEITVHTLSASSNFAQPMVYMQSGSLSGYSVSIQGPTNSAYAFCQLQKVSSGTFTVFGAATTITPQVGDIYRLVVTTGNDGFNVLSFYQNGFLILQCQDYANAFTTGNPGMVISAATLANTQISLWAGGNANVIPIYQTAGQVGAFIVGP
jgi:hypothetical protein